MSEVILHSVYGDKVCVPFALNRDSDEPPKELQNKQNEPVL